jgi:hypothetical protein
MEMFLRCEKCGDWLGSQKGIEYLPPSARDILLAEFRHNHTHGKEHLTRASTSE